MGKVAPHAGGEVQLVLAGLKPFATVERSKDEGQFALAVSLGGTGMLYTTVGPSEDDALGEVAFTKPTNKHLMKTYYDLQLTGVEQYGLKEYHRKMGWLFGYSPEDVEAFIDAEIHCECTKCKGK